MGSGGGATHDSCDGRNVVMFVSQSVAAVADSRGRVWAAWRIVFDEHGASRAGPQRYHVHRSAARRDQRVCDDHAPAMPDDWCAKRLAVLARTAGRLLARMRKPNASRLTSDAAPLLL
jgi:hypothetical protein